MSEHKEISFYIRPLAPDEHDFVYSQDKEIGFSSGLIGHLRADHDTNGTGFYTTWWPFNDELKTQEFKDELDGVINELRFREDDPFLKNRTEMEKYCFRKHPETKLPPLRYGEYTYGVRVNTKDYAYLMRLDPQKGNYNLYCYCYKRDTLDEYLWSAKHVKILDATGVTDEMLLKEVCREYEAKLMELMGEKAFKEYLPEVSKKVFRKIITEGMAEGEFKDFIVENFDNITE